MDAAIAVRLDLPRAPGKASISQVSADSRTDAELIGLVDMLIREVMSAVQTRCRVQYEARLQGLEHQPLGLGSAEPIPPTTPRLEQLPRC